MQKEKVFIHKKILVSHRGRDKNLVENTLESFANALASRVDIVEVDVRFSKDHVPFLYHLFVTSDTDRKFIFAQKDAEYIQKRFYPKTGQKIASLEEVIKYFLENRTTKQKIAIDIKDYGYEEGIIELLKKHDLFDKVIIFTWTPQVILRLADILEKLDKKVPIFFSHLRSDAVLGFLYKRLFGYTKRGLTKKREFNKYYRYVFLNKYNYNKSLGEYAVGYAHVFYSSDGVPEKLAQVLRKVGGGICVNSRVSDKALIDAKRQGLKTMVFGGVYGALRISNVHKFTYLTHNKNIDYIFIDNITGVLKSVFYSKHLVLNASPHNWLFDVVYLNIMFFITSTIVWSRKNFLYRSRIKQLRKDIQEGDMVLVGQHRTLSGFLIRGVVTHSGIYYGNNLVVHSIVDGVNTTTLQDIFALYDTMIVLRAKDITNQQKEKVKEFLKESLSRPYDMSFNLDNDGFYCTELVHKAFVYAGVNNSEIIDNDKVVKIIEADDFLLANYDIIFISKSLIKNNAGVHLNNKVYKNKFIRWFLEK